jgi:hypothetical protein
MSAPHGTLILNYKGTTTLAAQVNPFASQPKRVTTCFIPTQKGEKLSRENQSMIFIFILLVLSV